MSNQSLSPELPIDITVEAVRLALESAAERGAMARGYRDALDALTSARKFAPDQLKGSLAGPDAEQYLSSAISTLAAHAQQEARRGYGAFQWLWYLRRAPESLFEGPNPTTAPYDRTLLEIVALRGAPRSTSPRVRAGWLEYPLDESTSRRIVRRCGFSRAISLFHVWRRWCGKGAVLHFTGAPTPALVHEPSVERAVHLYDQRVREDESSSRFGTRVGHTTLDDISQEDAHDRFLMGFERMTSPQLVELPDLPNPAGQPPVTLANYRTAFIPLDELAEITAHPAIAAVERWHGDIPALLALLAMVPMLWLENRQYMETGLRAGYMILGRENFETLTDDLLAPSLRHVAQRTGLAIDADSAAASAFRAHLYRMEPSSEPLLPGAVLCDLGPDQVVVNLAAATGRLGRLLEFPRIGGSADNLRARVFEDAVQAAIDATAWRCPDHLRALIRRHLTIDGHSIGEIDALAYRDDTCLLISCKSILYTEQHDMGIYSSIRNTASTITDGIARWDRLIAQLMANPVGNNFDLSNVSSVVGVLVTPHVMYLPEPLVHRESLPGLRTYSSAGELIRWLQAA